MISCLTVNLIVVMVLWLVLYRGAQSTDIWGGGGGGVHCFNLFEGAVIK